MFRETYGKKYFLPSLRAILCVHMDGLHCTAIADEEHDEHVIAMIDS